MAQTAWLSSVVRFRASRTGRSSPATGASPPTFRLRINCTCAWFAPPTRMAASSRSIPPRRARRRASSRCGPRPTSPKFRRSIFASRASKGLSLTASRSSPADRVRYVGEPVAVVFAADAYAAEDAADLVTVEIEALPELLAADAPPGEFDTGHSTEVAIVRKGYGDVAAAFAAAHDDRRARTQDRPAQRRAAGDARRHRALRRGARCARALRRRQGAALEPRQPGAHARPRALLRASARRSYRRRLRRARRALSRGRARLPRRAAAAAAR